MARARPMGALLPISIPRLTEGFRKNEKLEHFQVPPIWLTNTDLGRLGGPSSKLHAYHCWVFLSRSCGCTHIKGFGPPWWLEDLVVGCGFGWLRLEDWGLKVM